jgi:ADP-ribose pyrophosphatase YjhB (NUDIX family)
MTPSRFPTAFQCYKPRHHKVFGCICISPNNKIALVRGALTGKWSFPKGHMENTETAQECAFRELGEETGLSLVNEASLGYRKFSRDGGGYFIYQVADEYKMTPKNTSEISECGWFSENDIRRLSCNKDVNSFLALLPSTSQ